MYSKNLFWGVDDKNKVGIENEISLWFGFGDMEFVVFILFESLNVLR